MNNYTYYHDDGTTTELKETVQKLLEQLKDGGLTYGEAQCALTLAARDLKREIKNYQLRPSGESADQSRQEEAEGLQEGYVDCTPKHTYTLNPNKSLWPRELR